MTIQIAGITASGLALMDPILSQRDLPTCFRQLDGRLDDTKGPDPLARHVVGGPFTPHALLKERHRRLKDGHTGTDGFGPDRVTHRDIKVTLRSRMVGLGQSDRTVLAGDPRVGTAPSD